MTPQCLRTLHVCITASIWINFSLVGAQFTGLFNAALGRPTWQSSDFGAHTSDRAVDGCTSGNFGNNCCSHTGNTADTWWSVDLGRNYTVREIWIYNRDDFRHRLVRFTISGSLISGQPSESDDKKQCAYRDESFDEYLRLACYSTARYILIEKNIPTHWRSSFYALTLCEVQVYVECLDGTYGLDCTETCSPHCRDGAVCNIEDGYCPGGLCSSGYFGQKCDQPCVDGYFGENCENRCSQHCTQTCDRLSLTGSCSGRCETGFTGDNCTLECPPGLYGDSCVEECRCSHDYCNHVTGCNGSCLAGWEGEKCLQRVAGPTSGHSSSNVAIYGSVAGVLVVILMVIVIGVIVFWRRKKQRRHPGKLKPVNEEEMDFFSRTSTTTPSPEVRSNGVDSQLAPVSNHNAGFSPDLEAGYESQISDEGDEGGPDPDSLYMNIDSDESKSKTRIRQEGLVEYIDQQKQELYPFKMEYETIPKQTSLWKEAEIFELRGKNRYKNILPYDYNRVVLSKIAGDNLSDYINASFIKDYGGNTAYIAALGVTKATLADFWRMIWEQEVSVIVMVTNLYEDGKIKCDQYWPSQKQAKVGSFTVTITLEDQTPSYVLRKMTISKDGEKKTLSQYHYTDWPDKGAPANLRSLLRLREVIRKQRKAANSPVLVHCSAGVGRTGTVIALDILLDQLKQEKAVDIRQCVVKLRKQRTNMVQTIVQYIFLYEAMEEIISIGDTSLSCQNLKSLVKKDGAIPYEKQFEFLERRKPKLKDIELEFGQVTNKGKNRDSSVIPAFDKRAKIPSRPEIYVNAVLVKGYSVGSSYCLTQIPLHNTLSDFWSLVMELKSSIIVCLQFDQTDKSWLPTTSALPCGDFTVKLNSCTPADDWTEYDVAIYGQHEVIDTEYANVGSSQEQQRIKVIAVSGGWVSSENSDTSVALFGKIYNKMKRLRQNSKSPLVTVMCLNGAELSGLFVAGSYLVEMAEEENQVDVFHTAKHVRNSRPQAINSLDQYKFLHKLPVVNIVDKKSDSEYYNI